MFTRHQIVATNKLCSIFMTLTGQEIFEKYNSGQTHFDDIDGSGDLTNMNLEGISFDNCFLDINLRNTNLKNARFTNGNIKTCDFENADLTGAHFEKVAVEATNFFGAKIKNTIFKDNYCYSSVLQQKDLEYLVKTK